MNKNKLMLIVGLACASLNAHALWLDSACCCTFNSPGPDAATITVNYVTTSVPNGDILAGGWCETNTTMYGGTLYDGTIVSIFRTNDWLHGISYGRYISTTSTNSGGTEVHEVTLLESVDYDPAPYCDFHVEHWQIESTFPGNLPTHTMHLDEAGVPCSQITDEEIWTTRIYGGGCSNSHTTYQQCQDYLDFLRSGDTTMEETGEPLFTLNLHNPKLSSSKDGYYIINEVAKLKLKKEFFEDRNNKVIVAQLVGKVGLLIPIGYQLDWTTGKVTPSVQ